MKQLILTLGLSLTLSAHTAGATTATQLDANVTHALRAFNVDANVNDLTTAQKVEITLIAHLSGPDGGKRQQIRAVLGHTVWQLFE
ncbi:hypothetical protein [Cochlodiniinecator piscidefendens]|uniref:hypothetical protein n=1 Tax=Cochlodiniinecator piscidefendens TaxID=2715756 RepID=UPI001408E6CE|nr:hypothetical protein [Cochlodiniinecator piscidefendens]